MNSLDMLDFSWNDINFSEDFTLKPGDTVVDDLPFSKSIGDIDLQFDYDFDEAKGDHHHVPPPSALCSRRTGTFVEDAGISQPRSNAENDEMFDVTSMPDAPDPAAELAAAQAADQQRRLAELEAQPRTVHYPPELLEDGPRPANVVSPPTHSADTLASYAARYRDITSAPAHWNDIMTRQREGFLTTLDADGCPPSFRATDLAPGGDAANFLCEYGLVCITLDPDQPNMAALGHDAAMEIQNELSHFTGTPVQADATSMGSKRSFCRRKNSYPIRIVYGESGGFRIKSDVPGTTPSWFNSARYGGESFEAWQTNNGVIAPAAQSDAAWALRETAFESFCRLHGGDSELVAMVEPPVVVYPKGPGTELDKGVYPEHGPVWRGDTLTRIARGPAYNGMIALTDGSALHIAVGQHLVAHEMLHASRLRVHSRNGDFRGEEHPSLPLPQHLCRLQLRKNTLVIWNAGCMHHLSYPLEHHWFLGLLVHYRRRRDLRPCELSGFLDAYRHGYRVPLSPDTAKQIKGEKDGCHTLTIQAAFLRNMQPRALPSRAEAPLRHHILGCAYVKSDPAPWLAFSEWDAARKAGRGRRRRRRKRAAAAVGDNAPGAKRRIVVTPAGAPSAVPVVAPSTAPIAPDVPVASETALVCKGAAAGPLDADEEALFRRLLGRLVAVVPQLGITALGSVAAATQQQQQQVAPATPIPETMPVPPADRDDVVRAVFKAHGVKMRPCALCASDNVVALYRVPNRPCDTCINTTTRTRTRGCPGCWDDVFDCRVLYAADGSRLPLRRPSVYVCGHCNRNHNIDGGLSRIVADYL
jgi:hypothetical protein